MQPIKSLCAGLAMCLASASALAADSARPTFTKDVLPILQENCQTCHRLGGANMGGMVAPMAFETYAETRPWAKAIAKQVSQRNMPPWHASPMHAGVFENERWLSEDDIGTLVKWAETGAARGNPKDAPEKIAWPDYDGWTIGKPDMVVKMPEKFFVDDDVEDIYMNFEHTITREQLPEPRWIKAVEFKPGSPVVHHIITRPFGGIAPGNDPTVYPEGVGVLIEPDTEVTWQMHYHKEPGPGTGVWDRSELAVIYYEKHEHIPYPLQGDSLGTVNFTIPAGDPSYSVHKEYTFAEDALLVQFMPHMHLRGKSAHFEAFYPDGTREVVLDVPRYDFNWQTTYRYKEFKPMPKGTVIRMTTTWDNSADNPYNPDPTADVRFGRPTTAEMSFGWMKFVSAEPVPDPDLERTD